MWRAVCAVFALDNAPNTVFPELAHMSADTTVHVSHNYSEIHINYINNYVSYCTCIEYKHIRVPSFGNQSSLLHTGIYM